MKKITVVLLLIVLVSCVYGTAFKMPKGEGHYEFVLEVEVAKDQSYPVVKETLLQYMKETFNNLEDELIVEDDLEIGKLLLNMIVPVKVGLTKLPLRYTLKILFKDQRIKFVYDLNTYVDSKYYPNKKEIGRALESFEKQRSDLIKEIGESEDEFDF